MQLRLPIDVIGTNKISKKLTEKKIIDVGPGTECGAKKGDLETPTTFSSVKFVEYLVSMGTGFLFHFFPNYHTPNKNLLRLSKS